MLREQLHYWPCARMLAAPASSFSVAGSSSTLTALVPASFAALERVDNDQPINAAALQAAASGDAVAVAPFTQKAYAPAVAWDVALQVAAAAGHAGVVDAILDRAAERVPHALEHALAASALTVAHQHGALTERLLTEWQADPVADECSVLWLAVKQRDAELVTRMLTCPAAAAAGAQKRLANLALGSTAPRHLEADLELLELLLADPPEPAVARASAAAAREAMREARQAERVCIVQQLLIGPDLPTDSEADTGASNAAAVHERALQAVWQEERHGLLEALLEDPRVDVLPFAMAQLLAPPSGTAAAVGVGNAPSQLQVRLDAGSVCALTLMRQPAVLRALALPASDAGPRVTHALTATDAHAVAAAAWRRRRAAVLAYCSEL